MPERPNSNVADRDHRLARQGRTAAIVIAVTMLLWMGGQYLGGQMGWPLRFAFLMDLAAIAALVWALFVTYWVWKARRSGSDRG